MGITIFIPFKGYVSRTSFFNIFFISLFVIFVNTHCLFITVPYTHLPNSRVDEIVVGNVVGIVVGNVVGIVVGNVV